jgi:phosphatidylserine decarboxylase
MEKTEHSGRAKRAHGENSAVTGRGWILKEGYPFIAPPLIIGLLGCLVGWFVIGGIGLVVAVAVALFFRNPSRRPSPSKGAALAPADGRVLEVTQVDGDQEVAPKGWKISIFMSVFNVHVNRVPVHGKVVETRHEPGAFRPAYREETSVGNERNLVRLRMETGQEVVCVQVAGILARRIVCWVREGASLAMGEPFGMIRFGSRVDSYFPPEFEPDVRVNQRVWGGQTVLGYFRDREDDKEIEAS